MVHEVFGHRAARVGRNILQRSRVRGAGGDHDGEVHRAGLLQALDHAGYRRLLLADGDVDADHALFRRIVLLVNDRVDGDGRLAGLAVANDQLALAAADRNHAVDRFDAGLERHLDRLARRNARRGRFQRAAEFGDDGAFAVQRAANRIHHAADKGVASGYLQDLARALDLIAFLQIVVAAHDRAADVVLFQVQGQTVGAVGKLDHLAGHGVRESVDAGDAVANLNDGADFLHGQGGVVVLDLPPENIHHLVDLNAHEKRLLGLSYQLLVQCRRSS